MNVRARNPRGEGDRLRTALLDAASELIGELGAADRLSVRGVTSRAGVTPTALYLHFADRDELLATVVRRAFGELRRYLAAAESEHEGDALAQLQALCHAYIRFASERPGEYRVLFEVPSASSAHLDTGLDAFDDLVRATRRCLDGREDSFEAATLLWAGLHGYVSLRETLPRFPFATAERYVEQVIAAHVGVAGGR